MLKRNNLNYFYLDHPRALRHFARFFHELFVVLAKLDLELIPPSYCDPVPFLPATWNIVEKCFLKSPMGALILASNIKSGNGPTWFFSFTSSNNSSWLCSACYKLDCRIRIFFIPVGIILADYVENVSLCEREACFFAWNVFVIQGVVVKQRTESNPWLSYQGLADIGHKLKRDGIFCHKLQEKLQF